MVASILTNTAWLEPARQDVVLKKIFTRSVALPENALSFRLRFDSQSIKHTEWEQQADPAIQWVTCKSAGSDDFLLLFVKRTILDVL